MVQFGTANTFGHDCTLDTLRGVPSTSIKEKQDLFVKSRLLQREFRSIKVAYFSSSYITKATYTFDIAYS